MHDFQITRINNFFQQALEMHFRWKEILREVSFTNCFIQ